MDIPSDHPRAESLRLRHLLTDGFGKGFVARAGLIAHGRGEAFDYLLGERTCESAKEAEKAAAAALLHSGSPAVSVNGNAAALVCAPLVELAELTGSGIEVNLFYRTPRRLEMIEELLFEAGAKRVYGVKNETKAIPGLSSERSKSEAVAWADTVLLMLEDGDRTEKLKQMGKTVLALDLNPLSRTAQMADISIVDNIARAIPNMCVYARRLKDSNRRELKDIIDGFDNKANLALMESKIRGGFQTLK